ncbi:MAG: DUF4834 family protein [Bacteroidales bacterium]|nr:DUF4834 family protein [Bacteroidales bacterium]
MFGFLGFLLILFLLIVFIGLSIVGSILRMLFGFGKRNSPYKQQTQTNETRDYTETYSSSQTRTSSPKNRRKIFGDDEGEYVDFEEIN